MPPGAGADDSLGRIEAIERGNARATEFLHRWVIGGVSYTVITATSLNGRQSELAVGNFAAVNCYILETATASLRRCAAWRWSHFSSSRGYALTADPRVVGSPASLPQSPATILPDRMRGVMGLKEVHHFGEIRVEVAVGLRVGPMPSVRLGKSA